MPNEEPLLRVVQGRPTDRELAALVAGLAVVAARVRAAGANDRSTARPVRRWPRSYRPGARSRAGLPAGRGGWRESALPW